MLVMPAQRGEVWCPQTETCWYCEESLPKGDMAVLWYTPSSVILVHP